MADTPAAPQDDQARRDRLVEAALELAADRGWADLPLAEIAARAEVPLEVALGLYPCRGRLLDDFMRWVDHRVLTSGSPIDFSEGPRDRLFDILMRRFDVLQTHREGVRAIAHDVAGDPAICLTSSRRVARSMVAMLEAAGISTSGLRGLARLKGASLVYAWAAKAWMKDDSEDMAKTMAALDKALDRAEMFAGSFEKTCRRLRRRDEAWTRAPADEPPAAPSEAPTAPA
ncbi:hypothetical protein [Roseospirillum parvum]|uniref:TetR family transcriptional regulator n=1 Tax=Roseospirillum parvum TaxID=83401 RepID=A0A1G8A0B2_9PROT|nr:hypothetical protein [Roseospirillum parvum]SDH14375.1 hypothetical protein SAMN05421742_104280 [Roseospirillum parvum]